MRVIVTGGRDYADYTAVYKTLTRLHKLTPITTLVTGGANGADTLADWWARKNYIPVETFYADWKTHGKAAGPLRNVLMAEAGADLCVAFPGGKGTAHMVGTAEDCGIEVLTIEEGWCGESI